MTRATGQQTKILAIAADPKANDLATRWGGFGQLFDRGYVAIPTFFIEEHATLRPHVLTPAELLFVIVLMSHKRDARDPWPSYRRIAKFMGVSEQYAKKLARSLEQKHFLRRRARTGSSNEFDLSPLFRKLADQHAATKKQAKPGRRSIRRSGTAA